MVINLAASVPLFTQPSPLLFYRLLRSQSPESKCVTRGNETKTHSLRLESQLIDSNRVKVWHSYNLLTLHQLLLHLLNFLCEKLHFFSRYYVENSAHFWPFFSVDVTIISIANCQSNNASQQLGRVQTSVMSQQILRYEKE